MDTSVIPARMVALETQLVKKLGYRPYFEPRLEISTKEPAFLISWYGRDIRDRSPDFRGDSASSVLEQAEAYVRVMPGPDTMALSQFQQNLATLIDDAPASLDTAPLSEFNQNLWDYHA